MGSPLESLHQVRDFHPEGIGGDLNPRTNSEKLVTISGSFSDSSCVSPLTSVGSQILTDVPGGPILMLATLSPHSANSGAPPSNLSSEKLNFRLAFRGHRSDESSCADQPPKG
jgi:hypothetical protein